MRSLTLEEIDALERNGCTAEDWGNISVAEDFTPQHLRSVAFYGEVTLGVFEKSITVADGLQIHSGIRNATLCDVTVGDNCLIENVSGFICRYDIGEECYISGVGQMAATVGTTYGQGNLLSVLNEAGEGNIVAYSGLTSQMAALMVTAAGNAYLWQELKTLAMESARRNLPDVAVVGYRAKVVNTREVLNTLIGDDCEVSGASRLCDCTLVTTPEASCFVGSDVILENTIVSAGSSVVDGARLDNCFVGEACHIGKGFSAESSVFFANSHLDNGESCAAFCGPFTVSHHKASLLIGGQFSFYNAGSATNFSNHAYKLGPIHYGVMERGCKTASGSHLLMPARVGAFSVCLGKIQQHPDTRHLPFSYLIGDGSATYIVPGRNLCTVGTYRDVEKWPKRDKRPRGNRYDVGGGGTAGQSLLNFDWLNPMVANAAVRGRNLLLSLIQELGDDQPEYAYGDCLIRNSALKKGIQYYQLLLKLYVGRAMQNHYGELPESTVGTGEWVDLAGLLVPQAEVKALFEDIRMGGVADIADIEQRLGQMHRNYEQYKWNCTYRLVLDYLGVEMLTDSDLSRIEADYQSALREWKAAVGRDAEREYELGDMDERLLEDFLDGLRADSGK